MTSIFEGQPPPNKAFSNQNKGYLGSRYVYIVRLNSIFISVHRIGCLNWPFFDVTLAAFRKGQELGAPSSPHKVLVPEQRFVDCFFLLFFFCGRKTTRQVAFFFFEGVSLSFQFVEELVD